MSLPTLLFFTGCGIAGPLLAAWVKIRLWEWQNNRDRNLTL